MAMFNPPHPGEFISETYLIPFDIKARQLAVHLDVSPSTVSRLLSGKSDMTPAMAIKLSSVLGRTDESWLIMQDRYNLWQARKTIDIKRVEPLNFSVA